MTSRDFCYWLQGYFEIGDGECAKDGKGHPKTELNTHQVTMIRNHLAMVFRHEIDPSFGDKTKQDILAELHTKGGAGVTTVFNC